MEEIAKKGNIQSEWKTGLVEMQRRLEQFSNDLPETKSKVLMIKNETKDFLYKVEAKESYLSEKFGDLIVEYRKVRDETVSIRCARQYCEKNFL